MQLQQRCRSTHPTGTVACIISHTHTHTHTHTHKHTHATTHYHTTTHTTGYTLLISFLAAILIMSVVSILLPHIQDSMKYKLSQSNAHLHALLHHRQELIIRDVPISVHIQHDLRMFGPWFINLLPSAANVCACLATGLLIHYPVHQTFVCVCTCVRVYAYVCVCVHATAALTRASAMTMHV